MKIGIIGCGFWAHYQVAAWREADPGLAFAFCDLEIDRARRLAEQFGSADYFADPEEMLDKAQPDVVDIISNPESHAPLTLLASRRRIPVICQKPMAPDWDTAVSMVKGCREAGTPLFIHENFRWQAPIRALKSILDSGRIGSPFRSRIYFNSSFPVFENQPFLAQLEQMMVADVGVHLLDVCRYLFGEVRSLYTVNQRINPDIKGEDVSTILLRMKSGMSCILEMSYASIVAYDCFPQTLVEVEGELGSVHLDRHYHLAWMTQEQQEAQTIQLPNYDWVHPEYAVVQTSMVAIQRNFLDGLRGAGQVETSGDDNLKTLQLTYAAYESARKNEVVLIEK